MQPQPLSNNPTPTPTPTKTRVPQPPPPPPCISHSVASSTSKCPVCRYPNNSVFDVLPTIITVYSNSSSLNAGTTIYSNPTCTTPVSSGLYIKGSSTGNVTLLTAGGGVLTSVSCSSCF